MGIYYTGLYRGLIPSIYIYIPDKEPVSSRARALGVWGVGFRV